CNETASRTTGHHSFLNFMVGHGRSLSPIRRFENALLLKTNTTLTIPRDQLNPFDGFARPLRIMVNRGDYSLSSARLSPLNTNELKRGTSCRHIVNGAAGIFCLRGKG